MNFTCVASRPGQERPCRPIEILRALDRAGQLRRLNGAWGRSLGDCHEVAKALIRDISTAELPIGGMPWRYISAIITQHGEHAWVEVDNWSIDLAAGRALIVETSLWRDWVNAEAVELRACGYGAGR
jgi:hypothetical protein